MAEEKTKPVECVRLSNGATQIITEVLMREGDMMLCKIENGSTILAERGSWVHYGVPVTAPLLNKAALRLMFEDAGRAY